MGVKTLKALKYSVMALNVLIFLCGIALLTISSSIQKQINTTRLADTIGGYSMPAGSILAIIISILFLILGIAGIYAAFKERYKFLIAYSASMAFIFLIQIITGSIAVSVRNNPKFPQMIRDKYMSDFSANSTNEAKRDHLQEYFKCCGWNSINDYITLDTLIKVPTSCCKDKTTCNVNDLTNLFDIPCKDPIILYVRHYIETIGISLIVFGCVNFATIVVTAVYIRLLKDNI
ncbi:unnamed protein product [Brachionus calyciflorus]|uniref:Tetraspanin n=1 Tax=Brachionus calyciflorus TaxID=104777 RepID=A0A813SG51_9BILA|nr:unnamed protein product [Brachionus calyciflorus]